MKKTLALLITAVLLSAPALAQDETELACCTELRESELCNLNQEHVRLRYFDTDRGTLPLSGQVMVAEYEGVETKTGEERLVPLVPRAALILERWISQVRDENPSAPVFFGLRLQRRIIARTLSEHFATYRRQAALRESLTFHSTRHTFVSWLFMLGLPIYQVRELAGHSGIKITDQYAHMARRYLHGQARQVGPYSPSTAPA